MIDNMFFYLFLVFLFLGIGEYLGVITKAKISAVFVSLILFLIGFMSGMIPANIIDKAQLTGVGKWSTGFIIFHMGTMINIKQLLAEWRTVVTAVLSMIVVAIAGFALTPLIGYSETIVAIPIINGGIVATQIMTTAAMEQGLTLAAALGTILYAVQKFVGTPIASFFGLKEAKLLLEEYRRTGVNPIKKAESVEEEVKVTFAQKHKKFFGAFTCLAITGCFAWVAFMIGKLTGVSYTIWCLVLGAVFSYWGLVPDRILEKAGTAGFLNAAMFATIIPSLAKIKIGDLASLGYLLVVLFAVTVAVLFLFFYVLPLWKIIGSRNLAMGVSMMQFLGFPATYLVAMEVAQAAAENEEEKEIIMDAILPKYLVGGFATVTSLSVIMAGILVKFL